MSDQFLDVEEEPPVEEAGIESISAPIARPHGEREVDAAVLVGDGVA